MPGKQTWVNVVLVEYGVNAIVWNVLSVEHHRGLFCCCWGVFHVEMFEVKLWLVIQGCDIGFEELLTQAWYTNISQNQFQKQGMGCYVKVIN